MTFFRNIYKYFDVPQKAQKKNQRKTVCTKSLKYLVLVVLFMARMCFIIGSPYAPEPFSTAAFFLHISPNMYDTALISIKKPQNATLKGLRLPDHSFPLSRGVLSLSLICFYSTCVFLSLRKTSIAHYSSNPVAHPNCLFHCLYLETKVFFPPLF